MPSIDTFQIGDEVTRFAPTERGDRSYIGEILRFRGIGIHKIFLLGIDSFENNKPIELDLDEWSDDWELWEPLPPNPSEITAETPLVMKNFKSYLNKFL